VNEIEAVGEGVWCVDTQQLRPRMAAAYLIEGDGRYAFVECGTSLSVPRLLAALQAVGGRPEQVDWLLPTHVHLDHAGGTGALAAALPNARVAAHPRALRHLVDPGQLIAGAGAVYGAARLQAMYGEILPVAAERVVSAGDGFECALGGRRLRVIDAPGHARHHLAVWDAATAGWFTGDVFGLSYREFDGPRGPFLMPTTTPVQFDPPAWARTLDRLLAVAPQRMYLTHYGVVESVAALAASLRAQLDAYQRIARDLARLPDRHHRLVEALADDALARLAQQDAPLAPAAARALLAMDLELNAQGLEVWLDRHAA
jgi:Zn-dependent hydrolases, including glyoxylases